MKKTLELLMVQPKHFPLEITVASGDRYYLPHPDYVQMHPDAKSLVIYPPDGPFSEVINPKLITSIKAHARRRRACIS